MSVIISFENDFQHKLLTQVFQPGSSINTVADVQSWKDAWATQLKSWHSPYKCLLDFTHVTIVDDDNIVDAINRHFQFFEKFFLRKSAGFGLVNQPRRSVAIPIFKTIDEALTELGIRSRIPSTASSDDFRSQIQIQNHFNQHVVELTFQSKIVIASPEQVAILRNKLTNNLAQWHSKWNLLIDCSNLTIDGSQMPAINSLLQFLSGFFLKNTIGYSPCGKREQYPFETYRARHNAAARLENEGVQAGDDAQCQSKS